jgi:hypothetical protein
MSDPATQLVRAYLHINGYFTATEYPLVEKGRGTLPRSITDIDLLAIRFGHRAADASVLAGNDQSIVGPVVESVDPMLGCDDPATDMILGEIKQGRAHVNAGSRNLNALAATHMARQLVQRGSVTNDAGHRIRTVLFASRGDVAPHGWHLMQLGHVFRFLQDYLQTEGSALSATQLLDPALAWLALLKKCDLKLAPVAAKENPHDDQTHHGHRAGTDAKTA